MASAAKVVFPCLDNDRAPDDRMRPDELYQPILKMHHTLPLVIDFDVPQISDLCVGPPKRAGLVSATTTTWHRSDKLREGRHNSRG